MPRIGTRSSIWRWVAAHAALAAVLFAAFIGAPRSASAEAIKLGVLKTTGSAPVFIAAERGYFTAEGLTVELVFFASAQPVSVAVASGDIDVAYTGFTGGFYSLAGQGVLKIVGGGPAEVAGFKYQPFLVSNRAWDASLRSYKDFPGHSYAVSQIGSPPHYELSLLAAKFGFDIKSMRLIPLQSLPNVVSAIVGGQADVTMMPGNLGEVKLLGYAGDETPFQLVGTIVSTKTADERHDMVARVLRALHKAERDYHDAFTGPDGKRFDGPTAPTVLALLSKHTGQSIAEVSLGIPYVDADGRLDIADVLRQVAWYKSQGVVKGAVDGTAIIDRRYVVALPGS
jgi:NitT/TauT family transport system substrate-binding protein